MFHVEQLSFEFGGEIDRVWLESHWALNAVGAAGAGVGRVNQGSAPKSARGAAFRGHGRGKSRGVGAQMELKLESSIMPTICMG